MKPSDGDLNRAMAEALGWRNRMDVQWEEDHDGFASGNDGWLEPGQSDRETEGKRDCPKFCTDRNSLPAVYAALETAGATEGYFRHLRRLLDHCRTEVLYGQAWAVETAEPRLKVIAALRALGLWKPEWDGEDGGEQ